MKRAPAFALVLAGLTPLSASAHSWSFCMRWVIQQTDGNAGEDYYATDTLMRARGAKIAVMHPNWFLPYIGYASESSGCYSFTASETTNFTVTMWAESQIGATSNITLKAFEDGADLDDGVVKYWVISTSPGTSGGTVYLQNTAGALSNLIAWSTFVVYWIDHLTSPRLSGTRTLNLVHDACGVGGSCQSGNIVNIADGVDEGSSKKFLIGHEVGHWIQESWGGGGGNRDYTYPPPVSSPAACKFTGTGQHALRSQEWNAAAFNEGFPHYLSALAFNDHTETEAYFRYYKYIGDSTYDDLEADDWIVDLENAGSSTGGWLGASCSWASGTGTEIDWMRHYWDFRTKSGAAPTHYQLFKHLDYARDNYPWAKDDIFLNLTEALGDAPLGLTTTQQDALVNRWLSYAGWNGVDQ